MLLYGGVIDLIELLVPIKIGFLLEYYQLFFVLDHLQGVACIQSYLYFQGLIQVFFVLILSWKIQMVFKYLLVIQYYHQIAS